MRPATPDDLAALKTLAVASGLFGPDELDWVAPTLSASLQAEGAGERWLVAEGADGQPLGAAYFAPEPFSDRMWNLYFLAVSPEAQGQGVGGQLVGAVEDQLGALGEALARVLIVETSSTASFTATRAFYAKLGFDEEATIREFYGPGDHKVVFWKRLV